MNKLGSPPGRSDLARKLRLTFTRCQSTWTGNPLSFRKSFCRDSVFRCTAFAPPFTVLLGILIGCTAPSCSGLVALIGRRRAVGRMPVSWDTAPAGGGLGRVVAFSEWEPGCGAHQGSWT